MTIPRHFCWSRFGTEAGEPIEHILDRKENERQRNSGLFLWGIGNAISPSMRELIRVERTPEVIFSPIRSAPRVEDVRPSAIVTWTSGRDLDGAPWQLPEWSVVTSRAGESRRQLRHYALVCFSEFPLKIASNTDAVAIGSLENLVTSNRIGASQVTAVVRYRSDLPSVGPYYSAAFRARLVAPYLVQLCDPQPAVDDLMKSHSRGTDERRGHDARQYTTPDRCRA
jgi:hypothetical protein